MSATPATPATNAKLTSLALACLDECVDEYRTKLLLEQDA